MVIQRRPDLIFAVCRLARNEVEEAEGLRHSSLRMLVGWHDDPYCKAGGDVIARWIMMKSSPEYRGSLAPQSWSGEAGDSSG